MPHVTPSPSISFLGGTPWHTLLSRQRILEPLPSSCHLCVVTYPIHKRVERCSSSSASFHARITAFLQLCVRSIHISRQYLLLLWPIQRQGKFDVKSIALSTAFSRHRLSNKSQPQGISIDSCLSVADQKGTSASDQRPRDVAKRRSLTVLGRRKVQKRRDEDAINQACARPMYKSNKQGRPQAQSNEATTFSLQLNSEMSFHGQKSYSIAVNEFRPHLIQFRMDLALNTLVNNPF